MLGWKLCSIRLNCIGSYVPTHLYEATVGILSKETASLQVLYFNTSKFGVDAISQYIVTLEETVHWSIGSIVAHKLQYRESQELVGRGLSIHLLENLFQFLCVLHVQNDILL